MAALVRRRSGCAKVSGGGSDTLNKAKRHFKKGYMANWIEELLKIREVNPCDPPLYWLITDLGEMLDGSFYDPELQKVSVPKNKLYRVESVLHRRKVGK